LALASSPWSSGLSKVEPTAVGPGGFGSYREIIARGRMALAGACVSLCELANGLIRPHLPWSRNARVIHGMQEARGSSPLSSTVFRALVRIEVTVK
jgi:hypothetical protein